MAGQDKDAGADGAANAKRGKASERERPAQLRFAGVRSEFAFFCLGLKYRF